MVAAIAAGLIQINTQLLTLKVDGVERTALVYTPSTPSNRSPVVFAFHGHMGASRQAARSFDIQAAWPSAVVVYPQGLPTRSPLVDPAGKFPGWQLDGTEANRDIRFFDALYREVMARFHGDSKHVFAMGHSNGGAFIYTLWALRGNLFAGFASVEAAGARKYALNPKPIFVTIGNRDRIVLPFLQRASFASVLKVNEAIQPGSPSPSKGTLFKGEVPTILWEYDGGHAFPKDCVPAMIDFFKSIR